MRAASATPSALRANARMKIIGSNEHLFEKPELAVPDDRHRSKDRGEQHRHPDHTGVAR
jgi:hypothetical protein